jgi:hypothetical protein
MGIAVRLISPQYVAPFVKTNKNDRNDAEADHSGFLLPGRLSRVSIDALVNIATALGRTVHFEVHGVSCHLKTNSGSLNLANPDVET